MKRKYKVNQTLVIKVETDIFDTKMPTAQQIEKEIASAIMDKDIDINSVSTSFLWIEDRTR